MKQGEVQMDFTKQTNTLSQRKTLFEVTAEQPVDCDITLPEYFPDAVRVLKCSLTPRITAVQGAADRITAEGSALLRILYVSEENTVRCFEQNIPFSKYAEGAVPPQACVCATAKTEYVNCRVQSPRRLDIHGSICISFCAYGKSDSVFLCNSAGGGVQMRKKTVSCTNLLGCTEKLFRLSETLELGGAKPSIAQIVKCEATALLEDVKPVTNKALIKGELILRTLYIADDDTGSLEQMEHSLPISQITEADGAEEGCVTDCVLTVSSVEIAAKTDATGALRLLDASVCICAKLQFFEECETDIVLDAYSTLYALEQKKQNFAFQHILDKCTDTYLCRSNIDTASLGLQQVADVTCTGLTQKSAVADGTLSVEGTVSVGILYMDRERQWGYTERNFDYTYKRATAASGENLQCTPHITLCGIAFVLGADGALEVRAELDISAIIFSVQTQAITADITLDTESQKRQSYAALTIYFAREGESVWEIARRYNTTAEAILTQNALDGDTLTQNCKLLIPRV